MAELKHPKNCYHGKAVKKYAEAMGYEKQSALAEAMGMSQQAISEFYRSEKMTDNMIKKFADFFKINEDLIRYYSDEPETGNVYIENNTFETKDGGFSLVGMPYDTINNNNPVTEIMRLCKEKEQLLIRMQITELEKMVVILKAVKADKTQLDETKNKIESLKKQLNTTE